MPREKDRVIIDTNLCISFLLTKDYINLDKILAENLIILLFSQNLIDEFLEVSRRPKFKKYFSYADLQELLIKINSRIEFIEVLSEIAVCRDPKDNFLLSLARDGKATHLITGDKDLLDLKTFEGTKIITIANYLGAK